MSRFDITLFSFFIIATITFAVFLFRLLRKAAMVDIDTVAEERTARVREEILRAKFMRRFAIMLEPLQRRVGAPVRQLHERMSARLQHWENETRDRRRSRIQKHNDGKKEQHIVRILSTAQEMLTADHVKEASEHFREVLMYDAEHLAAWKGLGEALFLLKEYVDAREALMTALQLHERQHVSGFLNEHEEGGTLSKSHEIFDHDLAGIHHDLGEIAREMGEYDEAVIHFSDAVALSPHHPKNLDALLSTAILVKNITLAKETLAQLRSVNPENEKLQGFQDQIRELKKG